MLYSHFFLIIENSKLGAVFMAALGVAVQVSQSAGGLAVSIVSCTMSLSVTAVVLAAKIYNADECLHLKHAMTTTTTTTQHCWRDDFRVWAAATALVQLPGALLLLLFRKIDFQHLLTASSNALPHDSHNDVRGLLSASSSVKSITVNDVARYQSIDNDDVGVENDDDSQTVLLTRTEIDDDVVVDLWRSTRILKDYYFW
jgi:hypothetical protein